MPTNYLLATAKHLLAPTLDSSKSWWTDYMFFNCKSLLSLDLSNFNTQSVTNMESMFYDCKSLLSLDLSNFNTQNVTNMESILVVFRYHHYIYLILILKM